RKIEPQICGLVWLGAPCQSPSRNRTSSSSPIAMQRQLSVGLEWSRLATWRGGFVAAGQLRTIAGLHDRPLCLAEFLEKRRILEARHAQELSTVECRQRRGDNLVGLHRHRSQATAIDVQLVMEFRRHDTGK